MISEAPAIAFDLGPDLLKCEKDTVALTAPAGFTNFRCSTPGITHVMTVEGPGQYWVEATAGNGCAISDTIIVSDLGCGNRITMPNAAGVNHERVGYFDSLRLHIPAPYNNKPAAGAAGLLL